MSGASEPEIVVPPGLESGVFANVVSVFYDIDYVTIDFARLDPRDPSLGWLRRLARHRAYFLHTGPEATDRAHHVTGEPKYPFFSRYRMKRVELTPENKEILRRWRERAAAERRRRFPQFYKD